MVAVASGLPVRALMTAGPSVDLAAFGAPPKVVVEPYVPHRQVLPRTGLVINQGGTAR